MAWRLGAAIILAALFVADLPVLAAVNTPYRQDPGQDLLDRRQRQQRQRQLEQRRAYPPAPSPPTPEATPPGAADQALPCFQIDAINLVGATLLETEDTDELLKLYLGSCMSIAHINELIRAVTERYIAKGYITARAYIAPQDLTDKTLDLSIVEGRIESIEFNGSPALDLGVRSAMPVRSGDFLYLPDIEQGLDQINRLRSETARMQILPGSEPGYSKLAIFTRTEDQWRGKLKYDNAGSDDTGKHRGTAELEIDDLLGFYDAWAFGLVTSTDTNALTADLSLPFGHWTWNLSWSYSEYLSVVSREVDLYGHTMTTKVGFDYLFFRDGQRKLKTDWSLSLRDSERHLNSTPLEPQKATVAKIALLGDYYPGQWVLGGDVGYAFGLKAFGGLADSGDIRRDEPHYQFHKLTLGLNASRGFANGLTYRGSAQAQYSFQSLYSSEQLSIGGRDTVRGFEEDGAAGDRGLYVRNDIYIPAGLFTPKAMPGLTDVSANFLMGLDAGYVYDIAGKTGYAKCGLALGYSLTTDIVTANAVYARPICGKHPNDENLFYLDVTATVF